MIYIYIRVFIIEYALADKKTNGGSFLYVKAFSSN